jgi:hypothetical protein
MQVILVARLGLLLELPQLLRPLLLLLLHQQISLCLQTLPPVIMVFLSGL